MKRYRIHHAPNPQAAHNKKMWDRIKSAMSISPDGMTRHELNLATTPNHGYPTTLIRDGYLELIEETTV